jgi:hypothetical protein
LLLEFRHGRILLSLPVGRFPSHINDPLVTAACHD